MSGAVDFARLEAALGASREPTAKHICIGDSVQKARAACCARGRALLLIFAAAPRHPLATCRRHAGLLRRRRTRSKRRRPSFAATGCLILTFRRISRCAAPAWYYVPRAAYAWQAFLPFWASGDSPGSEAEPSDTKAKKGLLPFNKWHAAFDAYAVASSILDDQPSFMSLWCHKQHVLQASLLATRVGIPCARRFAGRGARQFLRQEAASGAAF